MTAIPPQEHMKLVSLQKDLLKLHVADRSGKECTDAAAQLWDTDSPLSCYGNQQLGMQHWQKLARDLKFTPSWKLRLL